MSIPPSKFGIFENRLRAILKKTLLKSTCPIGSFTCPRLLGSILSSVPMCMLTPWITIGHIAFNKTLTHWGRTTHICVGNLTINGSDNGLSPDRRQAIILTNAGILLIGPLGTNFSEILIEIITFSFKKMRLKVSSAKRWHFCLGLNVLTHLPLVPATFMHQWIGSALFQIMACHLFGAKPLSELMLGYCQLDT